MRKSTVGGTGTTKVVFINKDQLSSTSSRKNLLVCVTRDSLKSWLVLESSNYNLSDKITTWRLFSLLLIAKAFSFSPGCRTRRLTTSALHRPCSGRPWLPPLLPPPGPALGPTSRTRRGPISGDESPVSTNRMQKLFIDFVV